MPTTHLQIKVKTNRRTSSLEQATDGTCIPRLRSLPADGW
jgi:hypothetical protein